MEGRLREGCQNGISNSQVSMDATLMFIFRFIYRHNAPCILFLDEVDSLLNKRGRNGEHEASRR